MRTSIQDDKTALGFGANVLTTESSRQTARDASDGIKPRARARGIRERETSRRRRRRTGIIKPPPLAYASCQILPNYPGLTPGAVCRRSLRELFQMIFRFISRKR